MLPTRSLFARPTASSQSCCGRTLLADVSHRLVRQGNDTFLFVDVSSGPRYRFEFQRARIFDASELRAALDLDRTTEPSAAALAERLVHYYQNRGYLDATVKAREERLEEGSVNRILFEIREGQLARVVRRVHPCLPPAAPPGLDAENRAPRTWAPKNWATS